MDIYIYIYIYSKSIGAIEAMAHRKENSGIEANMRM